MIILPNEGYSTEVNEKINTYQFLHKVGCPVFNSVLFDEDENLDIEKLKIIKEVLKSDYCTVRYQYVKPTINPIKGGNKTQISLDALESKKVTGTMMWLLEPIDRTKNIYGINIYVNRVFEFVKIEIVGKGFDVSDLNRGNISPQELITSKYPIENGWNNEWWKFLKFNYSNNIKFEADKKLRIKKLSEFGLNVDETIFDSKFVPLPIEKLEKLLECIQSIDGNWVKSDEYIVSVSINDNNKLVFWDIQTPKGKMKILRR